MYEVHFNFWTLALRTNGSLEHAIRYAKQHANGRTWHVRLADGRAVATNWR